MLAKLKKEHEILRNKVRFIKAVIEDEIIITRVKKQIIARNLKIQKYSTMSELNEIQQEQRRPTLVVNEDKAEEEDRGGEQEGCG